jgi:hypothetical protein
MTPTWDETNWPPAIASLDPAIRNLALAYANEELAAGRHPDRALSFAISKARADQDELGAGATGIYVRANEGKWAIFSDASDAFYTFDDYEDALRRGGEIARSRGLPLLVASSDGAILEQREPTFAGQALHLEPGEGGWIVRGPGGVASYTNKKDGMDAARDMARELGADLIVHRRDGSVQERRHYAH